MADVTRNIDTLDVKSASTMDTNDNIITFDNVGNTTQTPFFEAVSQANTENGLGQLYVTELDILTADVLTLNATPLEVVAAPGAGYAISVIEFSLGITYATTPYATNTTIQLITDGADTAQMQISNGLAHTVTGVYNNFSRATPTAGQTQLLSNAGLQVKVATGDPTAGDSDITVYVLYRLIAI